MSGLRWRVHYWLIRLNPAAAVGVLALLLAGLLHFALTLPGQQRLETERAASLARMQSAAAWRAVQAAAGPRAEPLMAVRLRASLPPVSSSSVNGTLEGMQAASEAGGLLLNKGSYQLQAGGGQGVQRYSISLPVKGAYPALRAFIRQVLAEAPNLVLERVSFNRNSKEEAQVEAQLEFAAYFRKPE
ncbi:hypothetical protein [Massilia sp. NR 4-1]|uniref:hypothetical protein n=1 Tax=Massilia sp. NR 4-1 TaxID=1678028 RepID=UPI00067D169E|nr:hypothetical protein [Massilia sp. NR 4-1]AKU21524.1 hypothetical protein ACZ75_08620 [Massilia sp. NR 4-1]